MYKRVQYQEVKSRLEEPRRFIQVLAGPRQVGKSTLIGQVVDDLSIPFSSYSADDVPGVSSSWISDVWESVRAQMVIQAEKEHLLVIDEVQKLDNWSEVVKKEWDRDTREGRSLKVVLLGSSRLLLKKGLTESLAGRFELIRMTHWSLLEMQDAFGWDTDTYIYYGGYPGAASLVKDEVRWRNYVKDALVETAISKDVLLTSNIYKPALMRQLFELGCSYSGELLSLNKMLGQLQDAGNVTTLSNYLQILDQSSLLAGLQKYASDNARKYNSIPKYQVYNNALKNVYNSATFLQSRGDPKQWGREVESAVGSYLINQAELVGFNLYYWRDGRDEVDFVIEKNNRLVGLEVKSGRRGMNNGLSVFRELFRPYRTFVVGTNGIAIDEFLKADINLLFQ